MLVEVLKSKIHRVRVTQAELHYVGSVTIDEALMEEADFFEGLKVQIVNINNGERFETYVLRGERNSGMICLNGPAARKVQLGDIVIIWAYGIMEEAEARTYKPKLVFVDENNKMV